MRFVLVVLLVLLTKLTIATSDPKKHVHFKIYVPEIIKHHIHTKTVFIHVHEPKKKPPPKKKDHSESYREDWSHWSVDGNYDERGSGYEDGRGATKTREGNRNDRGPHSAHEAEFQGQVTPYDGLITSPGPPPPPPPPPPPLPTDNAYPSYYRANPKPPIPHYDDYQANYPNVNDQRQVPHPVPPRVVFPNGVTGYSYPPQYQIHENVVEDGPPDLPDSYRSSHEEGHSERLHSETGHLYTNELENFYDDKHEETSESVSAESKEFEDSYKNHGNYGYVGEKYIDRRSTTLR